MKSIKVIKTGKSSIQDFGRQDYLHYGVPVSGAMDKEAMVAANILVDNPIDYPVIESTFAGGKFQFNDPMEIAITGGNLTPRINGKVIKMWETIEVFSGDILDFGMLKAGLRAYISFNGLLDIEKILGSYSYYERSKIGISLDDNMILKVKNHTSFKLRRYKKEYIPKYDDALTCRVIFGEQYKEFSSESINQFLSRAYVIESDSDRMGYRFKGPVIKHKSSADIRSEGLGPGAIQIPGNGQPIIMMADGQSTGGYTKLGYVIQEDLWKLSQKKPGERVRFQKTDIKMACEYYKNRLAQFNESKGLYEKLKYKKMKVIVNGISYNVDVEYYE